jgi:hypothetical protein
MDEHTSLGAHFLLLPDAASLKVILRGPAHRLIRMAETPQSIPWRDRGDPQAQQAAAQPQARSARDLEDPAFPRQTHQSG